MTYLMVVFYDLEPLWQNMQVLVLTSQHFDGKNMQMKTMTDKGILSSRLTLGLLNDCFSHIGYVVLNDVGR
jgi:hypothetical protein